MPVVPMEAGHPGSWPEAKSFLEVCCGFSITFIASGLWAHQKQWWFFPTPFSNRGQDYLLLSTDRVPGCQSWPRSWGLTTGRGSWAHGFMMLHCQTPQQWEVGSIFRESLGWAQICNLLNEIFICFHRSSLNHGPLKRNRICWKRQPRALVVGMLKCHWWDQSYFWEVWSVSGKQPTTCVTLQETWRCHHISCEGTDAVWAHNRPAFLPAHTATAGRVSITETPRHFSRWQPLKQALAWGHGGEEVRKTWAESPTITRAKWGGSQDIISLQGLSCTANSMMHCRVSGPQGTAPAFGTVCPLFSCWAGVFLLRANPWSSASLCHELCCNIPSLPLPSRLSTCRKLQSIFKIIVCTFQVLSTVTVWVGGFRFLPSSICCPSAANMPEWPG